MAHNSRAKASTWAPLDVPTAVQFEKLDSNGANAVNGDGGGTWSPASIVEIGGSGLSARHVYGLVVIGADADTTYSVATARLVYIGGSVTADRIYSIDNTGAVAGDVIEFAALGGMSLARTVTIKDGGGTIIAKIAAGQIFGTAKSAKFVFISGSWQLLSSQKNTIGLVNFSGVGSISSSTLSSTPVVDVPGYTATLACVAGDFLLVSMALAFRISSSGSCTFLTVVVDGGTPTTAASTYYEQAAGAGTTQTHVYTIVYQVVNTGNVTFKAQYSASGSASVGGTGYPATISIVQFRP